MLTRPTSPAPIPAPMPGSTRAEIAAGAAALLPMAAAAIPFALLLGANAAAKGLSTAEMLLMSGLVFAGSSQFVAVGLWSHPAPWLALGLATLLVNLRHVLMGASLARATAGFGAAGRAAAAFLMADEVWAVALRRAQERPLTPAFYFGGGGLLYVVWLAATGLGAVAGAAVADPEALGLDFAFTALFIALAMGFGTGRGSLAVAAASAGAAILVARFAPPEWPGGLFVLAGALAGIAVAVVRR